MSSNSSINWSWLSNFDHCKVFSVSKINAENFDFQGTVLVKLSYPYTLWKLSRFWVVEYFVYFDAFRSPFFFVCCNPMHFFDFVIPISDRFMHWTFQGIWVEIVCFFIIIHIFCTCTHTESNNKNNSSKMISPIISIQSQIIHVTEPAKRTYLFENKWAGPISKRVIESSAFDLVVIQLNRYYMISFPNYVMRKVKTANCFIYHQFDCWPLFIHKHCAIILGCYHHRNHIESWSVRRPQHLDCTPIAIHNNI